MQAPEAVSVEKSEDKEYYKRAKSFKIEANAVKIKNLAVSPSEEQLVCTLANSQARQRRLPVWGHDAYTCTRRVPNTRTRVRGAARVVLAVGCARTVSAPHPHELLAGASGGGDTQSRRRWLPAHRCTCSRFRTPTFSRRTR